jgi:hypothetical protein
MMGFVPKEELVWYEDDIWKQLDINQRHDVHVKRGEALEKNSAWMQTKQSDGKTLQQEAEEFLAGHENRKTNAFKKAHKELSHDLQMLLSYMEFKERQPTPSKEQETDSDETSVIGDGQKARMKNPFIVI